MYPWINWFCRTSRCASFHSGDPDQIAPFLLYTVLLYIIIHTSAVISASRSHSLLPSLVTIVVSYCSVHFIGNNLTSTSSLGFTLKSTNFCFMLEVGQSYQSTQFWAHSFFVAPILVYCFVFFAQFQLVHRFWPWADIWPSAHFVSGFEF